MKKTWKQNKISFLYHVSHSFFFVSAPCMENQRRRLTVFIMFIISHYSQLSTASSDIYSENIKRIMHKCFWSFAHLNLLMEFDVLKRYLRFEYVLEHLFTHTAMGMCVCCSFFYHEKVSFLKNRDTKLLTRINVIFDIFLSLRLNLTRLCVCPSLLLSFFAPRQSVKYS